jgi:hypothetical protein
MPRLTRSASRAACIARVSKRRMRPGPGSGSKSSGCEVWSPPIKKLSGDRPDHRSTCSATALVTDVLSCMPRTVERLIGVEGVPSNALFTSSISAAQVSPRLRRSASTVACSARISNSRSVLFIAESYHTRRVTSVHRLASDGRAYSNGLPGSPGRQRCRLTGCLRKTSTANRSPLLSASSAPRR